MHNYQEIFTFQHLYQAYKMCLKGKRHKQEAIDFSLALSPSLWSLYYELVYHTYQVSGYHAILCQILRHIRTIKVIQTSVTFFVVKMALNRRFYKDKKLPATKQ